MSLKEVIAQTIKARGPLNIADYMQLCLSHNHYGYYKTQQVFGKHGDFTTAPEISQIFGELLAVWMLTVWQQNDAVEPITLCEAGPGRGTLMHDMLRTFKALCPEFLQIANIRLIETSPSLIEQQKIRLSEFIDYGVKINWQSNLETLGDMPLYFIANEFLDALPIQQYIYFNQSFYERKITLDNNQELILIQNKDKAALKFLSPIIFKYYYNLPENSIIELSPQREAVIQTISRHLLAHGGVGLFIDYGENALAHGDTLQAVKNHKYVNIFKNPGTADLTSHVDFYNLSAAAKQCGCFTHGATQGQFLKALGAQQRASKLVMRQTPAKTLEIHQAIERLTHPAQMGKLFKALAITPTSQLPPLFNKDYCL